MKSKQYSHAERSTQRALWNRIVAGLPGAHVLQSWEWAQVKSQYGWQPYYLVWQFAGGQVAPASLFESDRFPVEQVDPDQVAAASLLLERKASFFGIGAVRVLYAPKGPLLDWSDPALRRQVLTDLRRVARNRRATFLKIDPDLPLGWGIPDAEAARESPTGQAVLGELQAGGWRFSPEQIQFRNTVLIDLTPSEEELLANMKQKTRYNIRLAARRGVTVRSGSLDDLGLLYRMYAETSVRDGFVIREESYYRAVWSTFLKADLAEALIAEVEGQPVAAIFLFRFAGKAWYLYGMSRDLHREKMPNYLLQWEAMRRAKEAGCRVYDLWGAPDVFDESDSMWGVYRFKEGLGGQVVRHIGAWDLPLSRPLY